MLLLEDSAELILHILHVCKTAGLLQREKQQVAVELSDIHHKQHTQLLEKVADLQVVAGKC